MDVKTRDTVSVPHRYVILYRDKLRKKMSQTPFFGIFVVKYIFLFTYAWIDVFVYLVATAYAIYI